MNTLIRKGATAWRSLNPMQRSCAQLWIFFTVILGFAPIPLAWLVNAFSKDGGDSHPVHHGDVFLIASLLCFVGVAAMFRPRTDGKPRELSGFTAGTLVLGVANIAMYVAVSGATQHHDLVVDWLSGISYVGSALCSLACTVIAEGGAS
jgi:hypothetical protein